MMAARLWWVMTVVVCITFGSVQTRGAGISVGTGAAVNVGGGLIEMNCLDLAIAGQLLLDTGSVTGVRHVNIDSGGSLDGGTGSLWLAGDWLNGATFSAVQSTINLQDGCSVTESMMVGDNAFHVFSASTTNGKTLTVEEGSTQAFADGLHLQGVAPGQRLKIRSSANGQPVYFNLDAPGEQQITAVDVRDIDASGGQLLAPGLPSASDSVDSGNNMNWFTQVIDWIFSDGFESGQATGHRLESWE